MSKCAPVGPILRSKASEVFQRLSVLQREELSQLFSGLPPGHHRHWLPPVRESSLSPDTFAWGTALVHSYNGEGWGQECQQHHGRPLPVPPSPPSGREGDHHSRYHWNLASLLVGSSCLSPAALLGLERSGMGGHPQKGDAQPNPAHTHHRRAPSQ